MEVHERSVMLPDNVPASVEGVSLPTGEFVGKITLCGRPGQLEEQMQEFLLACWVKIPAGSKTPPEPFLPYRG